MRPRRVNLFSNCVLGSNVCDSSKSLVKRIPSSILSRAGRVSGNEGLFYLCFVCRGLGSTGRLYLTSEIVTFGLCRSRKSCGLTLINGFNCSFMGSAVGRLGRSRGRVSGLGLRKRGVSASGRCCSFHGGGVSGPINYSGGTRRGPRKGTNYVSVLVVFIVFAKALLLTVL